jgi:hypothetical protein
MTYFVWSCCFSGIQLMIKILMILLMTIRTNASYWIHILAQYQNWTKNMLLSHSLTQKQIKKLSKLFSNFSFAIFFILFTLFLCFLYLIMLFSFWDFNNFFLSRSRMRIQSISDRSSLTTVLYDQTDFVCLYNYEFELSLCKIVRSLVILLLPLLGNRPNVFCWACDYLIWKGGKMCNPNHKGR